MSNRRSDSNVNHMLNAINKEDINNHIKNMIVIINHIKKNINLAKQHIINEDLQKAKQYIQIKHLYVQKLRNYVAYVYKLSHDPSIKDPVKNLIHAFFRNNKAIILNIRPSGNVMTGGYNTNDIFKQLEKEVTNEVKINEYRYIGKTISMGNSSRTHTNTNINRLLLQNPELIIDDPIDYSLFTNDQLNDYIEQVNLTFGDIVNSIYTELEAQEGGRKTRSNRRKTSRKVSKKRSRKSKKRRSSKRSSKNAEVYCASRGYYYKRMKSGKSKRISKEDYMKLH
jgi:hypothetical protein